MAEEDTNLELSELDSNGADNGAKEADDARATPPQGTALADEFSSVQDLEAVYDIPVQVSAVLGKSSMQVSQLLKLGKGAIVELDRKVGEAIDIYVNNRLVARGEVVVVEDRLGITMTEIIKEDRG
ncbi:MAG: flagellar motor switch protein FliN [Rhodospirillales bacterium]